MVWKIPNKIGTVEVRQEGDPFTIESGKLIGERFISLVPVDEDNLSRWEFRKSTGQTIHTIDSNGDIIR